MTKRPTKRDIQHTITPPPEITEAEILARARAENLILIVADTWTSPSHRQHFAYDADGKLLSSSYNIAELILATAHEKSQGFLILCPNTGFVLRSGTLAAFQRSKKE